MQKLMSQISKSRHYVRDLERIVHNDWWRVPNIAPCKGMYRHWQSWILDSILCITDWGLHEQKFPGFPYLGNQMVYTVQLFESSTYLIKQAKNEYITRDVAQK